MCLRTYFCNQATNTCTGNLYGSSGAASGGGGSLLDGNFDEDVSSASFAEALRAWRGGGEASPAPAPAPARNRFAPPPALLPQAAPKVQAAPTLADKLLTLKNELGLPEDLTLMDAVEQANAVVGLGPHGTFAEQACPSLWCSTVVKHRVCTLRLDPQLDPQPLTHLPPCCADGPHTSRDRHQAGTRLCPTCPPSLCPFSKRLQRHVD